MTPEASMIAALIIPLVGAIGIAIAGRINDNLREGVTLTTAVLLAINVWSMIPAVMNGQFSGFIISQFMPGLQLALHVEPLGMMFAALASGLWIVNSIYSIGYMRGNKEKNQTRFYICFAVSISAAMGIAFSANLLTLFIFYEALTLSTYPLVSHKGDVNTVRSARVYVGILLATSIGLFLPAIIWVYFLAGTVDFVAGGVLSPLVSGPQVGLLLALFVFGIGKAAIMPVHKWLPAAMVAPTPVSALLHAVAVVKAGVFAITKIVVYIFDVDFLFSEPSGSWLVFMSSFTIIVASIIAIQQTNLKRMLAYSTVSQLSYVILAVSVLKPLAEVGATVHIVAHAFGKITLFFAAGAIYVASKKTELAQLKGIGARMPWTMGAFTIGALSMIGVPPTSGFVSKWYILAGAFDAGNLVAILTIITSTALNAAYFLPVIYMAWFAKEPAGAKEHGEAPLTMVVALTFTAFLVLAFFFLHAPIVQLEKQVLEVAV